MSSNADYFLKKTLGEDFMESLHKFELWKPGTKSTLDHEEIRTALQIVPRTVMSLLIKELSPMGIGETKEIPLFVGADAKMRVTKHERDVYSGELEQDNKKIVDFKYRSLPGVGLVIMTAFELYDMENLINSPMPHPILENPPLPPAPPIDDMRMKVQSLIDERLALHSLVSQVVENKIAQKEAVHNMMMAKLTDELKASQEWASHLHKESEKVRSDIKNLADISKDSAHSDEYLRGMANGMEVANSIANKTEPQFVDAPKKVRPLKAFLEGRKKPQEYTIEMSKSENVDCADCGKNIFDGKLFSGCVCLGDDMERKVYIKKSEDGIKVRFSKGWDQENIEMLLEMLRKKHV